MKKITTLTIAALGLATTGAFAQTTDRPTDSNAVRDIQQEQDKRFQTGNKDMKKDHSMAKDKKMGDRDPMAKANKDHSSQNTAWNSQSTSSQIAEVDETAQQDKLQSSDIVGADVTDGQEHVVGTVSDIELSQSGEIEAVYLDIGGVLGIGSTTYRVPFDQVQVDQSQDEVSLTIEQSTLDELAALSEDLRNDMQEWTEEARDEMAETAEEAEDNLAEANENINDGLAATGSTVAAGAQRFGQQTERAGQQIQQGAQRAGQSMQNMTAEARQLKQNLQTELRGDTEASQDLAAVNVSVEQNRIVLNGNVRSEDARDSIVEAAEEIAEDREVVDNLQVSTAGTASLDY